MVDTAATDCKTCRFISHALGKKFMMPLLAHHYPLCRFGDVKKELRGLDLRIVGGLATRGWTKNDVDVVGERADIPTFESRLRKDGIPEPIHFCGSDDEPHSHLRCALYGIKMALTGKGY